jgi:hypothetical protein
MPTITSPIGTPIFAHASLLILSARGAAHLSAGIGF